MKISHRLIITALIAVFAVSCSTSRNPGGSKNVITPLSEYVPANEGSLVYALPLSVLDITISAERIIEKPGPYSRYSEDLLGLSDVIKNPREYWKINGITVRTHSELDPSQFYVIKAGPVFQSNVLSMKKEGLILDLNPEIYNTAEAPGSGSIYGKSDSRQLDLGADEYFQEQRDTLYKVVNIDTAFIRIPYLIEKKQKLSMEQLADRAARRLMELRDGKHSILTGETPVFPQNETAINEMNRMEKEYTDLFAGKIIRETHKFTYQIIPDSETAGKNITVCNFSESAGPVSSADKSGVPVVIEFLPELKTKSLKLFSGDPSGSDKSSAGKLFYRCPDISRIKITSGNMVLYSSRHLIYQFGEVIRMPSNYLIGK